MERIVLTLNNNEPEVMKLIKLANTLVKAGEIKELIPRGIKTHTMLRQIPPMPQLIAIPISNDKLIDDIDSILVMSNDGIITKEIVITQE